MLFFFFVKYTETETIQMKCGENIIPIQITKYKTCEYVESEEYVEYAEDDEGEEVEEIESLEEEEEIVNRNAERNE
ncbi:hypothetical protein DOY81_013421 [Sarcophaga bullata]|nr:hypothetical protein DOY81_013421 [Sarcophaga bullata]